MSGQLRRTRRRTTSLHGQLLPFPQPDFWPGGLCLRRLDGRGKCECLQYKNNDYSKDGDRADT
jgi:hypothetical protein